MDMEVDDCKQSLMPESVIAKNLIQEKDVSTSDLMETATVLVSIDNANGVKSSTSGSNNSVDHNGSTSDLSFQDEAIEDVEDYVDDDDDIVSDCDNNDEFFYDDDDDDDYLKLQAQFDNVDLPSGVEASVPWLQDPSPSEKPLSGGTATSLVQGENNCASSSSKAVSSSKVTKEEAMDDVLRKLMYFKQFDMVADCSDHHYLDMKSSGQLPSKSWVKKIQDEWKILEQNLPDTIFVRVYESRMDLLRAIIVGPSGTPYHDGLFVFDAVFPSSYPEEPPHFEDLVAGHFRIRAHDIMSACKAYVDGAEVGCNVKQWLEKGDTAPKPGSTNFKNEISKIMKPLNKYFINNGSKDTEVFQS
ncbi:putative ubiquitin-conjugating enzyme E2 38 [Bienertia sinuspersici]